MQSNENEETKEVLGAYPNVRRVMVSTQTFTLEEIHASIHAWIEGLREKGDIASLARIKYATMNADTSQAQLLKLVRLAIGSCYNKRVTNESMTNIFWPISFTQDLLGLLTALDYEISAVEEVTPKKQPKSKTTDSMAHTLWNLFRASNRNPAWFRAFKHTQDYDQLDDGTKGEFQRLAIEINNAFIELGEEVDIEF